MRISWISFLPFDWEIRKRIFKTVLPNSGLLFTNYACACKTAVLKDSFSNDLDFLIEIHPEDGFLGGEIRFRISRSIAKSETRISIPNRTHPIVLGDRIFGLGNPITWNPFSPNSLLQIVLVGITTSFLRFLSFKFI